MDSSKWSIGIAVVALVIAIIAVWPQAQIFGNVVDTSYFDFFQATGGSATSGGFKVGNTTVINGLGNITLPTSDTATSTIALGCIQTTATSTATAIRLVIGSVATSSATYRGTNTVGLVGWQYGTCP